MLATLLMPVSPDRPIKIVSYISAAPSVHCVSTERKWTLTAVSLSLLFVHSFQQEKMLSHSHFADRFKVPVLIACPLKSFKEFFKFLRVLFSYLLWPLKERALLICWPNDEFNWDLGDGKP